MTWEYFTGANKMNPIADHSIAKMCIGLTRRFLQIFYIKQTNWEAFCQRKKQENVESVTNVSNVLLLYQTSRSVSNVEGL